MTVLSKDTVKLANIAHWDRAHGQFRVLVHGSDTFGALAIMKDAPLPLTHLDTSSERAVVKLGENLHQRLEDEVRRAIARGARQVATGLSLVTHAELASL